VKLEYLCTYRADLKPPVNVGAGPFGVRQIFDVTGGQLEGPRLKGRLLASGGDWLLAAPDGSARLDVRGTFETGDGALIYVQYYGVAVLTEKVQQAMAAGQPTDYGDSYFMTQPRFETGDPRYAWLNQVVAVAEGRLIPNGVEYRVYHAVNG
jgi:hypothetical protein